MRQNLTAAKLVVLACTELDGSGHFILSYHHDPAWVGHDQRIHSPQSVGSMSAAVGLDFGVVRDVAGDKELLTAMHAFFDHPGTADPV